MSEIEHERSRSHKLMDSHPAIFRNKPPAVVSWVPPGWSVIVDDLCSAIELALGEDVHALTVVQAKEKFASLRFYYTLPLPDPPGEALRARVVKHAGGTRISGRSSHPLKQAVDQLVETAENLSLATCQWCVQVKAWAKWWVAKWNIRDTPVGTTLAPAWCTPPALSAGAMPFRQRNGAGEWSSGGGKSLAT